MDYEDIIFEKIRELMIDYDTASIQKKSFDFFIYHRLPRIIEEEPTLDIKLPDNRLYRVSFGQVFVDKPYLIDENRQVRYITPNEARLRELTYSSLISVNIRTSIVTLNENNEEIEKEVKDFFKIHLARIPMMIGTSKCNIHGISKEKVGECRYDNGGYFIIKGKERVLVTQERMNYNIVYVFEQKASNKFLMIADIRSMSDETGHSVLTQMKICNDINKRVVLQIPYILHEIPLGIVFRAYGFTLQEIEIILKANMGKRYNDPQIQKSIRVLIRDAEMIDTPERAVNYISQFSAHSIAKERRIHYIHQILNNELFPHLGITSSRNKLGFFLGHILNKLIMTFLKLRPEDDRDHMNNKRFEAAGHLMSELFRTLFKRFVRAMEPQLVKRPDILVVMSRMNLITQGIKHCFSTGNWGIPKSSYIRTGVSQVLSRLTYNSFLSHLRRIIIPIGKEGKNTKIRQIHPSQIGFICPSETPEGHSAGIVKNMTVIAQITIKSDMTFLRMILETTPSIICHFDFSKIKTFDFYKIFLNGNWVGFSYDENIFQTILDHRNCKRFSSDISISCNQEKEILIFGDEGRIVRPLIHLKNMGDSFEVLRELSLSDLCEKKIICFLDSHEIENAVIAMKPEELGKGIDYDYIELHPSLLTSLCVGLIPYVDHTQAPRITYHASMGKQAIGLYGTTNNIRTDTMAHLLSHPEMPLVTTHISRISGCDTLASGSNLIVAIAMYTGFNQEDSVILNQSSIQRGMFRSMGFRSIVVEERKKSTLMSENIELTPVPHRVKSFNYAKLDTDGIVKPGMFVGSGDVLVSRIQVKISKQGIEEKSDTSVIVKSGEEGYVDRIFISISPDGYKIVKIKIRSYKIPEIGDKVCSRNAQKGTVGITLSQEDMPFTTSGVVPDIIINPLCLPSRMTINQIIECVAAKCAVNSGRFKYSTPFSKHSTGVVDSLCDELHSHGFQRHGYETMYNGFTGEMLEAKIFIGPTYYQRLKHLVSAKIHARNHGSIQALTRQPLEGRSRDGGLRFGEMERDCTSGKTDISLEIGLSIKMKDLENLQYQVFGWDSEKYGMKPSKKIGFLNKGFRECVEIVLQDGRTIKCTPDHKFLTTENNWVFAKDLKQKTSRLRVSLLYPCIDIESELIECNNWSLFQNGINLQTNSVNEYLRTMAFMRILGWIVTDGGIYSRSESNYLIGMISLGHSMDVQSFFKDLRYFCHDKKFGYDPSKFIQTCTSSTTGKEWSNYKILLPSYFVNMISNIEGVMIGKKVCQNARIPSFVLDKDFPRPLLREFLGGMFGGDGHTCILSMHRGKRDVLTSVSFSKSRTKPYVESLVKMMEDMKILLARCGIHNVTIQKLKETSQSKQKTTNPDDKCYQSTLHLDISELVPFWEKIGFRHCVHKSLRLEAGASYKRLREMVTRQHNWLVQRVDEITDFSEIKKQNPTKIVGTKKAIEQAVNELSKRETLIHSYAIPTTHDITDHLVKGTSFGKFTSKSFPNAEEFMKDVGAYHWFVEEEESNNIRGHTCYAIKTEDDVLPTMEMTVVGIRPCGLEEVYDIEVEETNSFLANGVVAHNCMISHGVSRFLTERLFDMSDRFSVPVCSSCGAIPNELTTCMMCSCTNILRVPIPYACKLLFQELQAMGIKVNLLPHVT